MTILIQYSRTCHVWRCFYEYKTGYLKQCIIIKFLEIPVSTHGVITENQFGSRISSSTVPMCAQQWTWLGLWPGDIHRCGWTLHWEPIILFLEPPCRVIWHCRTSTSKWERSLGLSTTVLGCVFPVAILFNIEPPTKVDNLCAPCWLRVEAQRVSTGQITRIHVKRKRVSSNRTYKIQNPELVGRTAPHLEGLRVVIQSWAQHRSHPSKR